MTRNCFLILPRMTLTAQSYKVQKLWWAVRTSIHLSTVSLSSCYNENYATQSQQGNKFSILLLNNKISLYLQLLVSLLCLQSVASFSVEDLPETPEVRSQQVTV